jgi:hypothetical protein
MSDVTQTEQKRCCTSKTESPFFNSSTSPRPFLFLRCLQQTSLPEDDDLEGRGRARVGCRMQRVRARSCTLDRAGGRDGVSAERGETAGSGYARESTDKKVGPLSERVSERTFTAPHL